MRRVAAVCRTVSARARFEIGVRKRFGRPARAEHNRGETRQVKHQVQKQTGREPPVEGARSAARAVFYSDLFVIAGEREECKAHHSASAGAA